MNNRIALSQLPQTTLFRKGDVFVLFGELFGRQPVAFVFTSGTRLSGRFLYIVDHKIFHQISESYKKAHQIHKKELDNYLLFPFNIYVLSVWNDYHD